MLHALLHLAEIQDRDGGVLVLKTLFERYPLLRKLFADGGYQGLVFARGQKKTMPGLTTAIGAIRHNQGFEVLPRRWVMPQAGKGLREFAQRARLPQSDLFRPYAAKALIKLNNFPDRISGNSA